MINSRHFGLLIGFYKPYYIFYNRVLEEISKTTSFTRYEIHLVLLNKKIKKKNRALLFKFISLNYEYLYVILGKIGNGIPPTYKVLIFMSLNFSLFSLISNSFLSKFSVILNLILDNSV